LVILDFRLQSKIANQKSKMSNMANSANNLRCVIVTPEKSVLDEPVDFVAVPMYDGELGVLPGRQPLIGRLGFGELRVTQGAATKRFYVDGGFVQIRNNVVTVLTSKAIPVEQLKLDAAQEALRRAQQPAEPEVQAERLKDQLRARAQLRMARSVANE
jgi:F-type H+-transporting ATPase subunit epsilon